MAQVKVFYEPEMELLTVFWQSPRPNQLCTELGNGIILIKDTDSGEPIGMELLAYKPGHARFDCEEHHRRSSCPERRPLLGK